MVSRTRSIGVAPSGFSEAWRLDVWIPLGQVADPANRNSNFLLSFGRLRDGMTLDGARRGLGDLAAQMTREHAIDKYSFTARPLHEVITENATRGLWMLLAATGLLLLIACTNVANLLLARAVVRERDLAIRASLGAGRRAAVRPGDGRDDRARAARQRRRHRPGVGIAAHLRRRWRRRTSRGSPRSRSIPACSAFRSSSRSLAGLIAGLAPAIHLLRSDLNAVIRSGGSRSVTGWPRAIGEPAARDLGSGPRAGARRPRRD